MDIALWLCLIPIIWSAAAYFLLPKTVGWRESALVGGAGSFLIVAIYMMMFWSNTHDTEILNGMVTAKERNKVSCEHSYKCNCYTTCSGSGDSRTCTEHCSTCYDHSYDVDWDVMTTVGNLDIDRVDRQGLDEPPRWSAVQIGEAAATTHSYTNYVRAAPNSLFNMKLAESEATRKAALIPAYPKVYDYYRVQHALDVNVGLKNLGAWDNEIDNILRTLGASSQANILVIFVTGVDRDYKEVLERAWIGAKKNDVIISVGVTGTKIDWVEAFTFGKTVGNAMLAIKLRDELQALGTTEKPREAALIIDKVVGSTFKRKAMEDFKYLTSEAGPSATATGWLVGIIIVLLIVSTILCHKHDVFMVEGGYADRMRNVYRSTFRRRY